MPEPGTTITTDFTSLNPAMPLADGDPKEFFNGDARYVNTNRTTYNVNASYYRHRGFRLGYVALLDDGTRQYLYEDSLYFSTTNTRGNLTVSLSATVPEKTQKLFLVVVPAPREYYQHQWDNAGSMTDADIIGNDDQWPYTLEFQGTNLLGAHMILDDFGVSNCAITYDVELPYNTAEHAYTEVYLNDPEVRSTLGTAFQMPLSELPRHLVSWSSSQPEEGEIKFYAVNPITSTYVNGQATAWEPGHWFTSTGNRCNYGTSSYLFSELNTATMSFRIGQYPARLTVGQTYTISQCFRYKKGGKIATAQLIFRVKCVPSTAQPAYTLTQTQQDPALTDYLTPIRAIRTTPNHSGSSSGDASSNSSSSSSSSSFSSSSSPVTYFTPSGTSLAAPHRGFLIHRHSNGTTRKVMHQ